MALVVVPAAFVGIAISLIPGRFARARIDWLRASSSEVPMFEAANEPTAEAPDGENVAAPAEPEATPPPSSRGFSPILEHEAPSDPAANAEGDTNGAAGVASGAVPTGAAVPSEAPVAADPALAPAANSPVAANQPTTTPRVTVWPRRSRSRPTVYTASAADTSGSAPSASGSGTSSNGSSNGSTSDASAAPSIVYVPIGIPMPIAELESGEMPVAEPQPIVEPNESGVTVGVFFNAD